MLSRARHRAGGFLSATLVEVGRPIGDAQIFSVFERTAMTNSKYFLPNKRDTESGSERRVGVEIELSGLELKTITQVIMERLGGHVEESSSYELQVVDTSLGTFKVEIDSQMIKRIGREMTKLDHPLFEWKQWATDTMALLVMNLVPGELVAPPVALSRLGELDQVISALRTAGAKGTRQSPWYAFGVHFNVELPRLDAPTITAYMKAFSVLYDWLIYHEDVDITRRIPPYIKPFPATYVQKLVNPEYWPDLPTLIDDYLEDNPTRNRALDMLPLFQFLDPDRVNAGIDDPLVTPRPALHYRLPNSEIDDPDWGLATAWNDWVQVEALANDPGRLDRWCYRYWLYLQQPMKWPFIEPWQKQVTACLLDLS